VLGVRPLNVAEVCQFAPSLLYSVPVVLFSVTEVVVLLDMVGAEGADWLARFTLSVRLRDAVEPLDAVAITVKVYEPEEGLTIVLATWIRRLESIVTPVG